MKLTLMHAVAVIILAFRFATPLVAGPLEDANAAMKRRDYATAPAAYGLLYFKYSAFFKSAITV
jgi:hypothetical protein